MSQAVVFQHKAWTAEVAFNFFVWLLDDDNVVVVFRCHHMSVMDFVVSLLFVAEV
jgi:hypothetical protein